MEGGSSPPGGWRPSTHQEGRRCPPHTVSELLDIECTCITVYSAKYSPSLIICTYKGALYVKTLTHRVGRTPPPLLVGGIPVTRVSYIGRGGWVDLISKYQILVLG